MTRRSENILIVSFLGQKCHAHVKPCYIPTYSSYVEYDLFMRLIYTARHVMYTVLLSTGGFAIRVRQTASN